MFLLSLWCNFQNIFSGFFMFHWERFGVDFKGHQSKDIWLVLKESFVFRHNLLSAENGNEIYCFGPVLFTTVNILKLDFFHSNFLLYFAEFLIDFSDGWKMITKGILRIRSIFRAIKRSLINTASVFLLKKSCLQSL